MADERELVVEKVQKGEDCSSEKASGHHVLTCWVVLDDTVISYEVYEIG